MAAAQHTASPNQQPVPPAPSAVPTTSASLLSLVHTLIAFGRRLAETLANHPSAQTLHAVTRIFGTRDFALIMARILRGLRLAEALEQRLQRNARQIDNPRFRLYAPRPPIQRDPAAPSPQPEPANVLAHLPTAEEIAEQIRHRPIGAVLADICRDLGISPAHPAWGKLFLAIAVHRGNVVRLLHDMAPRLVAPRLPLAAPPQPATIPFSPTPATGPP